MVSDSDHPTLYGESSQGVPGADFGGIFSDFPTPVRGGISPRLFVARRKTGYLVLSTGSGDYVRDIYGVIGSGPGTGICRTSPGGCRTARLTEIFATAKTIFFPPNSPYEIDRKRYKIILGIRYDNSNKMDFHEKNRILYVAGQSPKMDQKKCPADQKKCPARI